MALPDRNLSDLLPYVMPYCEGCPQFHAERMIREATIQFCEISRAWRHTISVTLSAQDQAITLPQYTALHEIEAATWEGRALTPVSFIDADPDQLTGQTSAGSPSQITALDPGKLSIYPYAAGTVRVALFLKPARGQALGTDPDEPMHDAYNVAPSFIVEDHAELIADGALSRILMMPNKPYSDPQKAMLLAAKFKMDCDAAATRYLKGKHKAPMRTKARWM